jgi:hypothetical protein
MRSLLFPLPQFAHALSQDRGIRTLEFSIYDARDEACSARRVFRIAPDNLRSWWQSTVESLRPYEEVGLNSRVQLQERTVHLPMVDTKGVSARDLERLARFIEGECPEVSSIMWLRSGRSFHGYGSGLLDEKRWGYFMGTLLLYRPTADGVSVDTRWVGHRLRDGYGCLRLSQNSSAYVQQPEPLGSPYGLGRSVEVV